MWKSKFHGAFVLNHRVVLHAIDAKPARRRGGVGSSPLDGASAATSSPRNDLVKNCRVHATHWLISTQVVGLKRRTEVCGGGGIKRNLRDVDELKATIAAAARTAGVGLVFETDYVENANPGGFCDQLRRFASADVLVSVHGAHLVNAPWIAPGGLLLEALPYGHKRKKHHARLLRNTDLEYVRVCGVRPSSSLPKKESLCEGRTAAARKCALVARDCYETPLRPRSEGCSSSDPCECLDVLEKRLTGFFARRRQSGGRPRRRRSSRKGRGEEAL